MSKLRLFKSPLDWFMRESFLDWFMRDQSENSLEVSFAGCTVRLINDENIIKIKDDSCEYYLISKGDLGSNCIIFEVLDKFPKPYRNRYVNRRLRRWRNYEYCYSRWYEI